MEVAFPNKWDSRPYLAETGEPVTFGDYCTSNDHFNVTFTEFVIIKVGNTFRLSSPRRQAVSITDLGNHELVHASLSSIVQFNRFAKRTRLHAQ